jgi:rod shape-determining protein MreC
MLGSSAQRPSSAHYPSRSGGPLRRRIILGVLVVVSLVLITVYFRESDSGPLHDLQGTGTTILHPFEVGATRVARPFQDLYDYVRGLTNAKSERDRLLKYNQHLRARNAQLVNALKENATLKKDLHYISGPQFPKDYRPLTTSIVSRPESQFEQQVVVSAGSSDGVTVNDPVVTADGLVGTISRVAPHEARVTLLTDEDSAASAVDIHTRAFGIVRHGHGPGQTLFLDQVPKSNHVAVGDKVATSGWKLGKLSSLFPAGLIIGRVTSVSFPSTEPFPQVQVTPYVNFSGLQSVIVLVPKAPASPR